MDPFSLAVAKVDFLFKDESLLENESLTLGGVGTGFFFDEKSEIFLITNWHNVTGTNTAPPHLALHSKGLLPNTIRIHHKRWGDVDGKKAIGSKFVDLPLYFDGLPVWIEHSTRSAVDVVAIPIDAKLFAEFANRAINTVEQEHRLVPKAGMDCFVLGFPEGLVGPALTPIWKRGSIAAEPYQLRPYLIDAATRKGMSGSPVILRHSGIFSPGGRFLSADDVIGTVERFAAIYSGRVGDDAIGFQLGTAWPAAILEDIFAGRLQGKHPHSFDGQA